MAHIARNVGFEKQQKMLYSLSQQFCDSMSFYSLMVNENRRLLG